MTKAYQHEVDSLQRVCAEACSNNSPAQHDLQAMSALFNARKKWQDRVSVLVNDGRDISCQALLKQKALAGSGGWRLEPHLSLFLLLLLLGCISEAKVIQKTKARKRPQQERLT